MDYIHATNYNALLTRKCTCGGNGEMLCDFVADFVVRCSKCHLSTHAYVSPEAAATHWNSGDDIMQKPLDILIDDLDSNLQGEIVAIWLDEDCAWITQQCCDFGEAIIEYTDKLLIVEHHGGAISIDHCNGYNPKVYNERISPRSGEKIQFDHAVVTEGRQVIRLEFRWHDTWLTIAALENTLVISRDITPWGEFFSSADGDYSLK